MSLVRTLLAAAVLSTLGLAARADDCPHGQLDVRYCDRDGDMVADAPTDPKQVEDPEVYRKVWDGFLHHMEKMTGKKVQFFAVQSNAAQIEAMRAGRLHIAGFNTGSNPIAVNCAGFVPFAMMASRENAFGYEMEIIVPADSPIKTVADLKGKTFAFTDPNSNSGGATAAGIRSGGGPGLQTQLLRQARQHRDGCGE
jgi:phosphonate transport system substrate-binding protein